MHQHRSWECRCPMYNGWYCTMYYRKRNGLSADVKVSLEYCGIAVLNANQIVGLITRNIVNKEQYLLRPLYKTIVRSHIEYRIQAWRPYHEKVYARNSATESNQMKLILKLRDTSYEIMLMWFNKIRDQEIERR